MTIQYIMKHDEWVSHVVSLIPDACAKDETKENIAFDLAMEFGILSGLVPSGWYPDEAVEHLIDREDEKGNLTDSDLVEFDAKRDAYHDKMKTKYEQEQAAVANQKDSV